ncbi:hypothetical protein DMN91_003537 [Ooceraea biroi]|uniref:Uncharacterized protein n=1 Tax=Ooceraea biroi TaxID=2015173 RepID=A0A3L8DT39_OOCBI|nr:hypothetical protein DMN91_003537 [Ooceraea biroi]
MGWENTIQAILLEEYQWCIGEERVIRNMMTKVQSSDEVGKIGSALRVNPSGGSSVTVTLILIVTAFRTETGYWIQTKSLIIRIDAAFRGRKRNFSVRVTYYWIQKKCKESLRSGSLPLYRAKRLRIFLEMYYSFWEQGTVESTGRNTFIDKMTIRCKVCGRYIGKKMTILLFIRKYTLIINGYG